MNNLTITQNEVLKPCPFCGGVVAVKYAELHGYNKYVIRCCGVNILRATKEGAIERWNTRAYGSQAFADVKLLRAALDPFIQPLLGMDNFPDTEEQLKELVQYVPFEIEGEYLAEAYEALAATDRPEYKEEG